MGSEGAVGSLPTTQRRHTKPSLNVPDSAASAQGKDVRQRTNGLEKGKREDEIQTIALRGLTFLHYNSMLSWSMWRKIGSDTQSGKK